MFPSINFCDCSLFPLYHSYVRHFSSVKWPLLNLALEFYLNQKLADEEDVMTTVQTRGFLGMAADDKANMALADRSLEEILAKPRAKDDVISILKIKCDFLFNYIKSKSGEKELVVFLKEFLEKQTFSDINGENFVDTLSRRFGEDFGQFLDSWWHEKKLPAYVFSSPRMYEIIQGNRTLYQILFSITNNGDADGLVGVNFIWGKGGNFESIYGSRPQNLADERFYKVKAGQSKEIGIVMDSQISKLWINTCLSQNLPGSMALQFVNAKPEPGAKPFEGERVLPGFTVMEEPGTIIVDNEDPGFEVNYAEPTFLKKIMRRSENEQKDYVGLLQFRLPSKWSNALFGTFYGRYKHSGHYIKAGDGKNKVSWKANLPSQGKYELCYHIAEIPRQSLMSMYGGRNNPRVKDFHFTVYDSEGAKELNVDLDGVGEGWYSFGTFFFPKGEAKVELTDQSKGELVYADAVRWTLRE